MRTATSPAWRASRAGWSAPSATAASARWARSGTWKIWNVWFAGVLDPARSSPRRSEQRGGHLHQRHAGGGDQPARHHGLGPHHRQHTVPQLPANATDISPARHVCKCETWRQTGRGCRTAATTSARSTPSPRSTSASGSTSSVSSAKLSGVQIITPD